MQPNMVARLAPYFSIIFNRTLANAFAVVSSRQPNLNNFCYYTRYTICYCKSFCMQMECEVTKQNLYAFGVAKHCLLAILKMRIGLFVNT